MKLNRWHKISVMEIAWILVICLVLAIAANQWWLIGFCVGCLVGLCENSIREWSKEKHEATKNLDH